MALTYSEMVPLGSKVPNFKLLDFDAKPFELQAHLGKKATVVIFMCCHCPYVVAVQDRIAALANRWTNQGVQFFGINSNDIEKYPADRPEKMKIQAEQVGFKFPYLLDVTQEVAKAFGAVCTPDIFVINNRAELVYRGRIDDSWKDPERVTVADLDNALKCIVNGQAIDFEQKPSMGCSIKWK